jgi:hypothetical protein
MATVFQNISFLSLEEILIKLTEITDLISPEKSSEELTLYEFQTDILRKLRNNNQLLRDIINEINTNVIDLLNSIFERYRHHTSFRFIADIMEDEIYRYVYDVIFRHTSRFSNAYEDPRPKSKQSAKIVRSVITELLNDIDSTISENHEISLRIIFNIIKDTIITAISGTQNIWAFIDDNRLGLLLNSFLDNISPYNKFYEKNLITTFFNKAIYASIENNDLFNLNVYGIKVNQQQLKVKSTPNVYGFVEGGFYINFKLIDITNRASTKLSLLPVIDNIITPDSFHISFHYDENNYNQSHLKFSIGNIIHIYQLLFKLTPTNEIIISNLSDIILTIMFNLSYYNSEIIQRNGRRINTIDINNLIDNINELSNAFYYLLKGVEQYLTHLRMLCPINPVIHLNRHPIPRTHTNRSIIIYKKYLKYKQKYLELKNKLKSLKN